jgi:hypothetical protein
MKNLEHIVGQNDSIICWIDENEIKNERGDPITFHDHAFLYHIYADGSAEICVMKAAQVGLSVLEILKMMWTAKTKHMDIIYTMPTDEDVKTFVGGKVNRIIDQNPAIAEFVERDNVYQKQIGQSVVYFRSTWTKRQAISVTSDWNIHDEIDASKQDVIETYSSRTQHSKFKWRHVFSHPSVPDFGVHVTWKKSDQKHWFIRCSKCDKEQFLKWPDSICMKRRIFQCKFCKKELTYDERRVGRWRARFPERKISGYWVSLLMAPWVTAGELIDKWNDPDTTKEHFFNFILGLPYESKDGSLTRKDIIKNIDPNLIIPNSEGVVIGCDSGNKKHYVVGTKAGIFYYGVTESWEDIKALLRLYPRSIAVIDALPDLTGPRQVQEAFPGRVYLAYYQRDKKTKNLCRYGEGKDDGIVLIDRNRTIQHVVEEFKDQRIPLQGKKGDWEQYIGHWKNMYRITQEDELGQPTYIWEKKNNNDHWPHATVYWRVGVIKSREKGEIMRADDPLDHIEIEESFMIAPDDQAVAGKKAEDQFIYGTEDLGLEEFG